MDILWGGLVGGATGCVGQFCYSVMVEGCGGVEFLFFGCGADGIVALEGKVGWG